uniref:L1 transposable element RRM domain-containing protein n=1 Tax=Latimeria chalumnae TaxID=7897 RepID=H3B6K8_LATCH
EVETGLQEIKSEIININAKLDALTHGMENAESRVSDFEDRLYHVENLTAEIHSLREKCNDLENRSCRILGIPEGQEGQNTETFVESLLSKVLRDDIFPGRLEIERVHRAFRPRPGPGERPRIIIAKFLRYQDKVAVLRRARELGSLSPMKTNSNLSTDLQAKRIEFMEARRLCHSKQLLFSLLYSAKLRVPMDGGIKFFTDPGEVVWFLKQVLSEDRLRELH